MKMTQTAKKKSFNLLVPVHYWVYKKPWESVLYIYKYVTAAQTLRFPFDIDFVDEPETQVFERITLYPL